MKIKTLKDIGQYDFTRSKLRAEAVKWIKSFQDPLKRADYSGEIRWIKHFFNLTEEDLK